MSSTQRNLSHSSDNTNISTPTQLQGDDIPHQIKRQYTSQSAIQNQFVSSFKDYLMRNKFINSASTFEQESKLSNPNTLDLSSLGFLFEWWCIYWSLYSNHINRNTGGVDTKDSEYYPCNVYSPINDNSSLILPKSNSIEVQDNIKVFSSQNSSMLQNKLGNESIYSVPINTNYQNRQSNDNVNNVLTNQKEKEIQPHPGFAGHNFQNDKIGTSGISSSLHSVNKPFNKQTSQNFVVPSFLLQDISQNNTKSSTINEITRSKNENQQSSYIKLTHTPIIEHNFVSDSVYPSNSDSRGNKKRVPTLNSSSTVFNRENNDSYPENNSHGLYSNNLQSGVKKIKTNDVNDNTIESKDTSKSNDLKIENSDIECLNTVNSKDLESQVLLSDMDSSSDFLDENNKNQSQSLIEHAIYRVDEPYNKIICCSFNLSGNILATGTSKTSIYMWDLNSNSLKMKLDSGIYNVTGLSFSQNNILASSSLDGTIRIWSYNDEGEKFNCTKIYKPKEYGTIHSIDIHPYNPNIICSSETSGYLRFWDINQDECIDYIKDAATKQAKFSPNGKLISTGESNIVKVFDVETKTLLHEFSGHIKPVQSIHWGESENTIISASEDSVKVWKLGSSMECIATFAASGNKNYYAIPHPQYIKNKIIIGAYKSIYIWDISINKQISCYEEIKAHDGIVSSLCSHGNSIVASTSHDSTVKLWRIGGS